jgi:hypothetical protein
VFAPELLPVALGIGALSAGIERGGMIETAGSNLLNLKFIKGTNYKQREM